MERPLLQSINGVSDLAAVPSERLAELATEIRAELLDIVLKRGGHLASNLGAVELTIALLRVFDPTVDRIVWDTGHQAYVYKMLTGRRELLRDLRQDNGCCGFLHRAESAVDAFGAGHAGTAISAALGFAVARDRERRDGRVIAVVGDGALGCGVSLEGLNSIIETTADFILVLNDNRMSIAPNVGALARYLSRIIAGKSYNRFKSTLARLVCAVPRVGPSLKRWIGRIEEATKSVLVPGVLFEELGLRYFGPLDGHDLPRLIETFAAVRQLRQPLVLHVLTRKGQGYAPAEDAPEAYHGFGGRGTSAATVPGALSAAAAPSFSTALGLALCEVLETDSRAVAITAGMCHGTGLQPVRERFAERFFDVGIAEEHAVVFAAGLAAAGLKPVVAIYATFMQRAMDYVFHDVCLQNLPVVFCLDRAGVVDDGPTHHGIHDVAFWRAIPNIAVLQPADGTEQKAMLRALLDRGCPGLLRYPRGPAADLPVAGARAPLEWGRAEELRSGGDATIWAVGREAAHALQVADGLAQRGFEIGVVNVRFLIPFDAERFRRHAAARPVVTLENHGVEGGFASLAKETLHGHACRGLLCKGWPRTVVPWGTEDGIRERFRMDIAHLIEDIAAFVADSRA